MKAADFRKRVGDIEYLHEAQHGALGIGHQFAACLVADAMNQDIPPEQDVPEDVEKALNNLISLD